MSKATTRIAVTLSLLALAYLGIVMVSSIVQLAAAADRIYLGLGQPVFWLLLTLFLGLLATPLFLFLGLPKPLIPPASTSGPDHDQFLTEFRQRLQHNPRLQGVPLNTNEDIPAALEILSAEADKVIRDTASVVFVSTAALQNGRIDGLVVLVTQFRMVWRIASIYHQRPTPRQMYYLYSNVGMAALLADSIQEIQFSELATPLVAALFPSINSAIPGLQGIAALLVNSIAQGSANSFLTLRVGIVARKYCETLTAPSRQQVRQSATVAALAMVAQITKENGARLVSNSWSAVKGAAGEMVESTVQGVKTASGKVVDATVNTAKAVGDAVSSTAQGAKNAASRVTSRKEPGK